MPFTPRGAPFRMVATVCIARGPAWEAVSQKPVEPDPAADGLSIAALLALAGTHALSTVRQILRPAGTLAGLEGNELSVGTRKKGEVYVLPGGERLLVTGQASCPRPAGVEGVLRQKDGKLYWLSHVRFDAFRRHLDEGRLVQWREAVTERWADAVRYRAEVVDG